VLHLKAPGDIAEEKLAAKAAPPPVKKKPPRKMLASLAGTVVLLVAAYFAWRKLTVLPPPPQLNLHRAVPRTKEPAVAANAADQTAPAGSGMIQRAQNAIANRRESEQERVDALAAGKDVPAPPTPAPHVDSASPGKLTTVEAHAQTVIAPGLTATTVTTMSVVEASPAFRSFVANLTVNGVFQGSPSRALINGHTFREGELIEPNLGIVFDHVDAARKQIVFKDRSGAIVERGY
jgi:hypothetical protein